MKVQVGKKLVLVVGNILTICLSTDARQEHTSDNLSQYVGRHVQEDQTVADVIQNDFTYESLVNALEAAGLTEDLNGADGTFTLFAPTNSALAQLPDEYFALLLEDPAYTVHLQNLLAFHVNTEGAFEADDLFDGMTLLMANEENVTVTIDGGLITLSNDDGASASVQVPDDAIASNGVIHQLGETLLPKFMFVDVLDQSNVFFQNLVASAGLEEYLRSGQFTIILPSNEAFVGIPSEILDDTDQLTSILRYHIIETVLPPQLLQNGQYPTLNGDLVVIEVSDDKRFVTFDGIPVDALNIARNGVQYSIDAVLLPGQNIPTFAPQPSISPGLSDLPNLATLINETEDLVSLSLALQIGNLMEDLVGLETATIFAPIDTAFTQVKPEFLSQLFEPEWIAHLQNVLSLHAVYPEVLYQDDLVEGMSVPTISGEAISIAVGDDGSVFVTGPRGSGGALVESNISASNGVLHKIDNLLLPTWLNLDLLGLGAQIDEISSFMGLITTTGLDRNLATGLYTLLAPSEDAFAALSDEVMLHLTNPDNQAELISVLQYHMIPRVLPTALLGNSTIETVEGSLILPNVTPGQAVKVNNASAIFVDIPARNGLIYIIDQVMEIQDMTASPTVSPSDSSPPLTSPDQTSNASENHIILFVGPMNLLVLMVFASVI